MELAQVARYKVLDTQVSLADAGVESDLVYRFDKAMDNGWTSAHLLSKVLMIQVLYVLRNDWTREDVAKELDRSIVKAVQAGEAMYNKLTKQTARGQIARVKGMIKIWDKHMRTVEHCNEVAALGVNKIEIKWSKSRADGTYGQTLVSGRSNAGTRSRAMGGGYSLVGEVVGDIIQADYQMALRNLPEGKFYGLSHRADGSVVIDGACGMNSVEKIVREGLGLDWQVEYSKRSNDERAVFIG